MLFDLFLLATIKFIQIISMNFFEPLLTFSDQNEFVPNNEMEVHEDTEEKQINSDFEKKHVHHLFKSIKEILLLFL